jgi:ribosomal protein S20
MNRTRLLAAAALVGAIGSGATVGLFLGVPGLSAADTPTPTPSSSTSPLPHEGPGLHKHFRAGRPTLDAAAKALGMTTADLKTALGNGQSIAAIAKAKHIDVNSVVNALVADATSRIDAAVSAGRLDAAKAATIKANLTARITAFVNGTHMPWMGKGVTGTVEPGHHLGARPSLDAAAKALGMTTADLKTALGSGQSIAAIAKSKNIDLNSVVNALVADATSRIDAAVSAGKLDAARAATIKQNLTARITAFVNATPSAEGNEPGEFGPRHRLGASA